MEKESAVYERMIEQPKIVKSHGWMVGNSPRSDINPAMQIGLERCVHPALEHMAFGACRARKNGAGKLLTHNFSRSSRAFLTLRSAPAKLSPLIVFCEVEAISSRPA